MTETSADEDFAPAAPFVGALTGARAAAITVALLTGYHVPGGLRWQYNFLSNRARTARRAAPTHVNVRPSPNPAWARSPPARRCGSYGQFQPTADQPATMFAKRGPK